MPRTRFHHLAHSNGLQLDAPWLTLTAGGYAATALVANHDCLFGEVGSLAPLLAVYVVSCAAFAWRAGGPWMHAAMVHAGAAVIAGMVVALIAELVAKTLFLACPSRPGMEFATLWYPSMTYSRVFLAYFAPILLAAAIAPVIGWPFRALRDAARGRTAHGHAVLPSAPASGKGIR